MKLFLFLLLFLFIHPGAAAALSDLDITFLKQQIAADLKDFDNRLILARHYLQQQDIVQVNKLIAEMKAIDPDNKNILELAKEAGRVQKEKEIVRREKNTLKKYNITDINNKIIVKKAILNLYFDRKFNELKNLYQILKRNNIELDKESSLIIAQLSILGGRSTDSKEITSLFKDPADKDFIESMAETCYSLAEYHCARDLYENLFTDNKKIQYGYKLIDIYMILGDMPNAEMMFLYLRRLYPDNRNTDLYRKKIAARIREHIQGLEETYSKTPDFDGFKKLLLALYLDRQPDRCDQLLKGYMLANMGDRDAIVRLAAYLREIDRLRPAIEVLSALKPLINPQEKLLLADFLSQDGKHDEALDYIDEIMAEKVKKEIVAKTLTKKAFILLRKNETDKARKLFAQVRSESSDDEVTEELLILAGKTQQLIKKYENIELEDGPSPATTKKLAQLSSAAGLDDKALYYYKRYFHFKPQDLSVYRVLADLYFKKNEMVSGLKFLEYYADKKGGAESLYLLAEKYYLAGLNEQSLNVLEQLLRAHSDFKKAIDLKTKITIKTEISKVRAKIVKTYESPAELLQRKYKTNSAQQLLHADKLYYKGFFKASLPYYQAYLVQEIEDNNVRYRYALALEKSSLHEEAAGEFYIMLWQVKDTEVMYRYAYNLEKTGKIKEAAEVYREILAQEPKQLPDFLNTFLQEWKRRQEKKDFKNYIKLYADVLKKNDYWKDKKQSAFNDNKFIRLNIIDPFIIAKNDNLYVIRFFQEFASNIKKDQGYKILELECENNKTCRISSEKWVEGEYKQFDGSLYAKTRQSLARLKTISRSDNNIFRNGRLPTLKTNDDGLVVEEPRPLDQSFPQTTAADSVKTSRARLSSRGPLITNAGDKLAQSSYLMNYLLAEQGGIGNVHIGPLRLESSYQSLMTGEVSLEEKFYQTADKIIYRNLLGVDLYWYEDASDTKFNRYSLYYKTPMEFLGITAFFEVGNFVVEDENAREPGAYLFASAARDDLEVGLYFYKFDPFTQVDPFIKYRWQMERHNLETIFYRRNASLIIKYSTCPIEQEISGYNLQISDYIPLENENYFWGAVDFTYFTDSNFATTPQFNFYFHNGILGLLKYKFFLAGWYNFNTKTTDYYYSPNNYDSTFFGVDLEYLVSKNFTLLGRAALGYSLSDNSSLYELGGWVEYELVNGIYAKAGCKKQNSRENTALSDTYNYQECEVKMEYRW